MELHIREVSKTMNMKVLFATLLTLALCTSGDTQTLNKAKLDQFFDRLAEKNKAMGSLCIAKDGNVLYTRAIGYSQITPRYRSTSSFIGISKRASSLPRSSSTIRI